MGEALGQVLPLGVGVALSPVPIIGVVLMLGTSRARVNGPVFLTGWLLGIAVVGTAVLAASSGAGASENHSPAEWASVLEIMLGALLLIVAVKQWRGRPRDDDEQEMPKWMMTIDSFTATRAALLRARGAIGSHPGRAQGLDVLQQRRDHGDHLPDHRGEAGRRRDQRPERMRGSWHAASGGAGPLVGELVRR